jgi:hypothetical protein
MRGGEDDMPAVRITNGKLDPKLEKELLKKLHRLTEDHKWIWDNMKTLADKYDNTYVAVMEKEVEYSDINVYNLITQIKADGKDVDAYAIDFVSKVPRRYLLELHARG